MCVAHSGGMQDYNYIFAGCMELTIEISCCKFPSNETELSTYWIENRDALLSLIAQANMGTMRFHMSKRMIM
jgi:Zinc carboxypeptidase